MPRLFSQSLRVAGLALTALAALTACDKKPAKSNKSLATAPAPKPTTKARGVPLAPLLAEIPEDTQWAVVVGHLGLATRHAGKATALFAEHPRFRGPLHRLTRRVTRVVGFRLLDPQSRRAAGLPDDAALVVARRQPAQSPPVTLVMVRGVKPLALLKGLTRALRRRGDRAIPEVKTMAKSSAESRATLVMEFRKST